MAQPLFVVNAQHLNRLRATMEKKLGNLVKDPSARALRSVGEIWMTLSKRRTPVKYGVLRGSGHVQGPKHVRGDWEVRLVFGGPAAPYAKIVHENLHARHRVGQAKYLESLVLERRSGFAQEIRARLKGHAR